MNNRPPLARLAIAALISAVGSLELSQHQMYDSDRPRNWRNPFRSVLSANKFVPHQSAREMARRRGGSDWQAFKAADRLSRGLPA